MSLFEQKEFTSHAGEELLWKIECDALTGEDIETLASIIGEKLKFRKTCGVPRGGVKLTQALKKYTSDEGPVLIVDDVLTTGASMEEARKKINEPAIGVVVFARGKCPLWVKPVFTLSKWAR